MITTSDLRMDFNRALKLVLFCMYSEIGREARAFFSGPSSRNRTIFARADR